MTVSAEFDHGFAKGIREAGPIAFNLSAMPWQVGTGLEDDRDWVLDSPAGSETMFAQHLLGEFRKHMKTIEEDAEFTSALRNASENHGELITLLPREGKLRHEAFSMLEKFIESKVGGSLRRFTSMKLYYNQEPSDTRNCVRKFKGGSSVQVVVNLSEFGYRFFRFHGKQHEDIDIDSMLPRWSDDPEEHRIQLESEIRMFDMSYFRRIREASESGTIYLLLPRGPRRRKQTMKIFLNILERVPSGAIDLGEANVRRIYPGATKTGELH
ncbi:MAG: hypothetical protein MK082_04335 [Phycisphaerales bacterium]|nr:hypothetical protein [Phycisphaerales bacterium]